MAKKAGKILAHWEQMIESSSATPLEFYNLVLQATARRAASVSVSYVTCREGGVMSARRVYLRVRRKRLMFQIGAAPFGNSLVVSWWLIEAAPGLFDLFIEIPLLGLLLGRLFRPATFHCVDQTSAFQHLVHDAVLEAVSATSTERVLKGSARQDRPILEEFYRR
jgi:hypothetical protein